MIAEFEVNPQVTCFGFRLRVGENEQTTMVTMCSRKKYLLIAPFLGKNDFDQEFSASIMQFRANQRHCEDAPLSQTALAWTCLQRRPVTLAETIFPKKARRAWNCS
jgi:hypothetical protein